MKKLFTLLLLASLSACVPAIGQAGPNRRPYDLEKEFGLNFLQGMMQVKNIYADTVAAKAKYPYFWKVRAAKGYRWGSFMALSAYDAAHGEGVYNGQGNEGPSAPLNSHNHILVPTGRYYQTITADMRGTELEGLGTGYVGNDGRNSVNTELVVWHEFWQGDPMERHNMQSSVWNMGKGNTYYSEGSKIENIAFQGRQNEFLNDKFNSTGLRLWYPGEVFDIDRLYLRNYRTAGIEVFGATPLNAGNISVFDNVVAGVIFYSSGATVAWGMLSGDDNGAMFKTAHGYNDTGGGLIHFDAIKDETGVASADRCTRYQIVGYLEGQFGVDIGVISGYGNAAFIDAAFVIDTRANPSSGYPPQNGSLKVGAMRARHYKNMIMQIPGGTGGLTGHSFPSQGDYFMDGFTWSSYGGGTFNWGVKEIPVNKVAHSCTARTMGAATAYPTGCTPYREIADGPPRKATITYLDQITGGTIPPPTCSWVLGTPGPWLPEPCTSGNQTQTTAYVSSVPGCIPAGTQAPQVLTRACPTTPPPPTGNWDPADVVVVINQGDPTSVAMAAEYKRQWGTTASVSVSLGSATEITSATAVNTAKTAIYASGKQYMVLAWAVPSRYQIPNGDNGSGQAITAALTFGPRAASSYVSPLYGYVGAKPRTDKGFMESAWLGATKYIRKDAHGTRPTGQSILLFARDSPSETPANPRGIVRMGQSAPGVIIWDNTVPIPRPGYTPPKPDYLMGGGTNACNCVSKDCFLPERKPTGPMVAAYQSMNFLSPDGGLVWQKGFYGDHVTSYGGHMPSGNGQTPLTYHLDRNASFSVGSVSEPWTSLQAMKDQFVNVSMFHPWFMAGIPAGVAAWGSVKCPDRMLFAGDIMCAPFK
jgi:hypothetical protein